MTQVEFVVINREVSKGKHLFYLLQTVQKRCCSLLWLDEILNKKSKKFIHKKNTLAMEVDIQNKPKT